MLSEEEKKAIEYLKYMKNRLDFNKIGYVYAKEDIETVLNLIDRLEEGNELQKENYKNLILDVSRIAIELGLEEDGTIDEIYAKIKEKDNQIIALNLLIDEEM